MRKIAPAILTLLIACSGAYAQNWRPPNPDQPNGYHASEAASHYHGDLHLPAQPQNGYHASEARSHYGGSRCEPASGWSSNSGGRWGESNSGGWGADRASGWGSGADSQASGLRSRWGGSEQTESDSRWSQTTPAEQTFARGVLRRTMLDRYATQAQQANVGQPDPGVQYTATNGLLSRRMATVENSASQMIRNGGGFNTIYAPESGR